MVHKEVAATSWDIYDEFEKKRAEEAATLAAEQTLTLQSDNKSAAATTDAPEDLEVDDSALPLVYSQK